MKTSSIYVFAQDAATSSDVQRVNLLSSGQHLRTRILSALLVPLVGMSILSTSSAIGRSHDASQAGDLVALLDLAIHTGNLLHETQTERGLTSLFLNSKGTASQSDLVAQRTKTDEAAQKFAKVREEHRSGLSTEAAAAFGRPTETLLNLAKQRQAVDALSIDAPTAIAWYTALNSDLLAATGIVAAESPDADSQRQAMAYVAFLNAKENVGIERARLAAVFGSDKFAPGQLVTVASVVATQKAFLSIFATNASPEVRGKYETAMKDPDVAAVATMEKTAFDKADTGKFGIDPKAWFTLATHKIDLMAGVEHEQGRALLANATKIREDAQRQLILGTALSALAVLLSLGLGIRIAARIAREIGANSRELRYSSDRLTQLGISLGSSANETAVQAQVVTTAGSYVSTSVQTVAAAVEEMNTSINEIAGNAVGAASAGAEAVSTVFIANSTISKLGESSVEIGKVLDVITSIAEQTNLLALNATIESARAGEAGKGFAVVANEVKELAKETSRATEEISGRISTIQSDTEEAVAAIGQIGAVVDRINDIQVAIAGAVEEQTAAVREIAGNISEAARGSSDIAENISGVANAAEETNEGAHAAEQAGREMAHLARQLQNVIEGKHIPSNDEAYVATSRRFPGSRRDRFGADRADADRQLESNH